MRLEDLRVMPNDHEWYVLSCSLSLSFSTGNSAAWGRGGGGGNSMPNY